MRTSTRLKRWQEAGLLDDATVARITAFEKERGSSSFSQALLGLGGFAILLGVAAIIGVNWASIPAWAKLGGHAVINIIAACAAGCAIRAQNNQTRIEFLINLLAGLTLTFIFLIGQIYQSQEPAWKAFAFWLVLALPMLVTFARSRFTVQAALLAIIGTYGAFVFDLNAHDHLSDLTQTLLVTLPPFVLIACGQNTFLRNAREYWAKQTSYTGFVLIALIASSTQISWSMDVAHDIPFAVMGFLITLGVSFAIPFLRLTGLFVAMPSSIDFFLPVSVGIGFAPLLIAHGHMPVLGAALVMIYWGLCGWVGFRASYPRALNAAITLIALRLFLVYVEVFGSMLQTGVGLIASGVLLIVLAKATHLALRRLPTREKDIAP